MARTRNAARSTSRSLQPGRSLNLSRLGDPQNALLAQETVSLAALIAYDLSNRGDTQRKLPRPGPVVGTLGLFAVLSLIGSFGGRAATFAVALGGLVTLTSLVAGARGQGIVTVFRKLASWTSSLGSSSGGAGTPNVPQVPPIPYLSMS